MKKISKVLAFLIIVATIIFPNKIILKNRELSKTILTIDSQKINEINSTINQQENLPVWSTYFKLKDGKDIEASFTYDDVTTNILEDEAAFFEELINESNFEIGNNNQFPQNHIFLTEPEVFRGILVRKIIFIPFSYNFDTNEMQSFNNIHIEINEIDTNENFNYTNVKLSRTFEP